MSFPLILAAALAAGCPAMSVHDGDSIRCGAERVRIADIDAPELPDSPKCEDYGARNAWCDYAMGYRARDALQAFLSRGQVVIIRQGQDKYGRTLALVRVNGIDAGEYLVRLGLARRWR
jgi:endonuclease YncB( thermonuclease family)